MRDPASPLFETAVDAPVDTPAPEPAPEPAPDPAPAPEPAPSEDQWQGVTREEWEAAQQRLGSVDEFFNELNQLAAQQQQPQIAGPQPPDPDLMFTDPAAYQQQFAAFNQFQLAQMLDQRLGPYQPALEQQLIGNVESEIDGMIGQIPDELKTVLQQTGPDGQTQLPTETIKHVAAGFYNPEQGNLGPAIVQAAQHLAEYTKAQREAAVEEFKKSVSAGSGSTDLGVGGTGLSAVQPATDYDTALNRALERAQAQRSGGTNTNF